MNVIYRVMFKATFNVKNRKIFRTNDEIVIKLASNSQKFPEWHILPRESSKLSLWYPICGKWTDINLSWSPRPGKELQRITWRITRRAQHFYLAAGENPPGPPATTRSDRSNFKFRRSHRPTKGGSQKLS